MRSASPAVPPRRTPADQYYRLLFQSSLDAVLLTTPDGTILDANAAACGMFEMTLDQLRMAGRPGTFDLADPRLRDLIDRREVTGRASGEVTMLRGDEYFPAEVWTVAFEDQGEERVWVVIRDMSRVERAEEALRLVSAVRGGGSHFAQDDEVRQGYERLQELRSLAGGLAHEFNNALTALLGNAGLAILQTDEDSPLRETMREVGFAGRRAADLIERLIDYMAEPGGVAKETDLAPWLAKRLNGLDRGPRQRRRCLRTGR